MGRSTNTDALEDRWTEIPTSEMCVRCGAQVEHLPPVVLCTGCTEQALIASCHVWENNEGWAWAVATTDGREWSGEAESSERATEEASKRLRWTNT